MKHYSNTKNPVDFPQVLAGADLHAGSGGYELGNREDYETAAKTRNKSLAQARIRELYEQATIIRQIKHEGYRGKGYMEQVEIFDKDKFAELIVRECMQVCTDRGTHHDYLYSAWADDCSKRIGKHFGVEQ